jgi:hypothetical protein
MRDVTFPAPTHAHGCGEVCLEHAKSGAVSTRASLGAAASLMSPTNQRSCLPRTRRKDGRQCKERGRGRDYSSCNALCDVSTASEWQNCAAEDILSFDQSGKDTLQPHWLGAAG